MRRTTAHCNSGILLTPFARKFLRVFGCVSSAYLLFVLAMEGSISFSWGVLLTGIGLISLYISTRPARRYYTPLIFTIFYFLGYLLALSYILLHQEQISTSRYHSIGNFKFGESDFFPVALVICVGIGGIMTAMLLAEKIFKHKGVATSIRHAIHGVFSMRRLRLWIWLWFGFSLFLALLMWSTGVGRAGLKEEFNLPYKLAGIAVFLRKVFVPFLGILLLDVCVQVNKKRMATLVLVFLLILGTLGSLGGISRQLFAFTVFPAVLFLFFKSQNNNFSQRLFLKFMVISVIACLCIMPLVQALRNVSFGSKGTSISKSLTVLRTVAYLSLSANLTRVHKLATLRFCGMGELLAVTTSGVPEDGLPLQSLRISREVYNEICPAVFGFRPVSNDTFAFGKSFGMWGHLFLSGSYIVVYFGTIFLAGFAICFEEIFIRRGLYSVALLFSILVGFGFWTGSISVFFVSRYSVLLIFCYMIMLFFLKTTKKRFVK